MMQGKPLVQEKTKIESKNDGPFFVLAQSLKLAFLGAPGAFWGSFKVF